MNEHLQNKIHELIRNPKNLGELTDADAVGEVGNSSCGEMLRLWVKFRDEQGRRVIDQASFQSFGCETAIAVASMATELIRGRTAEEALSLAADELTGDLGPLPPMKIHCAELVEGALKAALAGASAEPARATASGPDDGNHLLGSMLGAGQARKRIVLLSPEEAGGESPAPSPG